MLSLTEKILLTPLALKKDIKVLWIEHDNVGNWLTKNPSLPLLKKLSAQVTTVCVSDLSAEIFRSLGYKNVVAIPNGVKEAERGKLKEPACRQGRERDDGILRIGCIARLSPEKGVDVLIAAMKQVPDATLLVVGKGPQYVQSSKNVTLRYEVPDIEQVYSQIDVLVLPSREEDPFGLVVAEAMMRGIAVICTDACGIAGYLTDGQDALIVPAGSTEALVEAIERFQVSGFREQVATAGKKAAREKFSVERMVKDYESQITNHTV
ncbi:MAG: glycosyltransferase family 4 protein [Candidatus Peregrinibacteria bacterium]|nr:glycosyltransferase family 4 protein [Candidatus Peregrinibacteria bacterium]